MGGRSSRIYHMVVYDEDFAKEEINYFNIAKPSFRRPFKPKSRHTVSSFRKSCWTPSLPINSDTGVIISRLQPWVVKKCNLGEEDWKEMDFGAIIGSNSITNFHDEPLILRNI